MRHLSCFRFRSKHRRNRVEFAMLWIPVCHGADSHGRQIIEIGNSVEKDYRQEDGAKYSGGSNGFAKLFWWCLVMPRERFDWG